MEYLAYINSHVGPILLILASLGVTVELVKPIKIYPVTMLVEWVGKVMTKDIKEEIAKIGNEVKILSDLVDDNETNRLRYEILDFVNSVKHGRDHAKDEWEHIFKANDRYHTILKKLNQTNGYIDIEVAYLVSTYHCKCSKNDFLK